LSIALIRHHNYRISMSDYPLTDDYSFYVFNIKSFMKSQMQMYPVAMQYIETELNVKTTKNYIDYFEPKAWDWDKSNVALHYNNGGHMFAADPNIRDTLNNDIENFYHSE
jgi:hypothetical protein